jgi:hypothetical protein
MALSVGHAALEHFQGEHAPGFGVLHSTRLSGEIQCPHVFGIRLGWRQYCGKRADTIYSMIFQRLSATKMRRKNATAQ